MNRRPLGRCLRIAALLLACIASLVGSSRSDPPTTAGWSIGERAPVTDNLTWIRQAAAPNPAREPLTIVTFWATWDPVSPIIIARQDSIAARYPGRVSVLAISMDPPSLTRRFLAGPGATFAASPHVEIACDPHGRLFEQVYQSVEDHDFLSVPLTVILASDRTVLWSGFPVRTRSAHPTAAFDAVLDQILTGSYSLAAARAAVEREERAGRLLTEMDASFSVGQLARTDSLLSRLEQVGVPEGVRWSAVQILNKIAWRLATREGPTDRDLAIAERASSLGWGCGGSDEAPFVDTRARVLFETGRIAEAIDVQQKAVDLTKASPNAGEFAVTLAKYRHALEPRSSDSSRIAVSVPPPAPPARWSGSLNDAFTRFDKDREVFRVRPADSGDAQEDSRWTEEMERLSARFGGGVRYADEISPDARIGKVLTLYGTAGMNPLTREVIDAYGIRLDSDGVRFGDRLIAVPNPVLITALPSPWGATRPVVVYTSFRGEDAHGLNRLFHGPTEAVVGRRGDDGKLEEVVSFDYLSADSGRAVPNLPASELSSAEGIEDLRALSDMLAAEYAGFGDLDARLRASGSSWSERVASFHARIRGRDRWPWSAFVSLVQELLGPVEDTHFYLESAGPSPDGTFQPVSSKFIHGARAFFTGLIVERTTQGLRVASAPDTLASFLGTEPIGIAPIGDPYDIEMGAAYLFPTLPNRAGSERYLVGIMAAGPDTPANVLVRFAPGAREVRLPLHRGRMRESALYADAKGGTPADCPSCARPGSGFLLCWPPDTPIPWLSVRTMAEERLKGFADSADSLRGADGFVLDLRGNGGGSDSPAMEWMARLSAQLIRTMGSVQRTGVEGDPLRAFTSYAFGTWRGKPGGSPAPPPRPYGGKVAVLIDRGVASSGETMAQMAAQLSRATLIGENSAGCVNYGNVAPGEPLPHSRIRLGFGRTRFVMDVIRPNPEGIGFFPDYWLDEPDPIASASAWLVAGVR